MVAGLHTPLSYPASAASPFTSHSPACCKCSEVVDSDGLFSLMVLVEELAPGTSYSAIAVMSFYPWLCLYITAYGANCSPFLSIFDKII